MVPNNAMRLFHIQSFSPNSRKSKISLWTEADLLIETEKYVWKNICSKIIYYFI